MSVMRALIYEFGPYRLDALERLLLRDGQPVPLTPKVFDTLLALVERSGHVLEKNVLMKLLWPDSFVEDCSLTQNISLLRKALGENGENHFIETVPKCGYRFIAPVRVINLDPVLSSSDPENISGEPSAENILAEISKRPASLCLDNLRREPPSHSSTSLATTPKHQRPTVIFVSFVLLLGFAGGGYLLRGRNGGAKKTVESLNDIHSMAVLPFKQLGSDSGASGYLGLSMADALIVKLSTFQQMRILPTSAVFRYIGRERDVTSTGKELGVEAVLDGTIQRAGDRVRVTMMVIRVDDGRALWSEKFDAPMTDIFTLQDSISDRVAEKISTRLTIDDRPQLSKRSTDNIEAYQSYMMALYFASKRTKEGLGKSVEFFEQAIRQDPHYALAYAGLGDSKYLIAYYGFGSSPSHEDYGEARMLAQKALELDGTLGEAYATLAVLEHKDEKASEMFRKAIELSPDSIIAHVRYGWFLFRHASLDNALAEMKRAQELDPVSPLTNCALAQLLYCQHNYDEAILYGRRALELEPDLFLAHSLLSNVYERQGRYKETQDEISRARQFAANDADHADILEEVGRVSALTGRESDALKAANELREIYSRKPDGTLPINIALVYDALGQRDEALKWMAEQFEKKGGLPLIYRFDPRLENLTSDPRFVELRQRAIQNSTAMSRS